MSEGRDYWEARRVAKDNEDIVARYLPERLQDYNTFNTGCNWSGLLFAVCFFGAIFCYSFLKNVFGLVIIVDLLALVVAIVLRVQAEDILSLAKQEKKNRDEAHYETTTRTQSDVTGITRNLESIKHDLSRLTRELLQESLSSDANLKNHDFHYFLSHASEYKADFVDPLYQAMTDLGLNVFYDRAVIRPGDSLRRSIDQGLRQSRFAIVVFSPSFFKKAWTAHELDGLVTLQITGRTRIVPIWHRVSLNEVIDYGGPSLADKVALKTSLLSVREIASELHALVSEVRSTTSTPM